MQINTLKLKTSKKKRKTIGRGGKKGTYSGKGNKGQKARSGAKVDPLFEGGRSTLIDHMKKKKGFKSIMAKKVLVKIEQLEENFKDGAVIDKKSLLEAGLIRKSQLHSKIKVLDKGDLKKKITITKEIDLSVSAKEKIEKAGGKIE